MPTVTVLIVGITAGLLANLLSRRTLPLMRRQPDDTGNISYASPEQAFLLLRFSRATFIDVRTAAAYATERIPGALRLSSAEIEQTKAAFPDLERNQRLIAYCDGTSACRSSERLARMLQQVYGFHRVSVLKGGLAAWKNAGYPTE